MTHLKHKPIRQSFRFGMVKLQRVTVIAGIAALFCFRFGMVKLQPGSGEIASGARCAEFPLWHGKVATTRRC